MRTELIEVIRTETRAGTGEEGVPIHKHTQLWTPDGKLIVELCDFNDCETLEPPEGFY